MSKDLQITFPEAATKFMLGMVHVHSIAITIGAVVMAVVGYGIYMLLRNKLINAYRMRHETPLEILWTVVPTMRLILLAAPSIVVLYAGDEIVNPQVRVKAIGHQ